MRPIMKAIKFLGMAIFMALVSVCFTACSSDDDETSSASVEGKWYLKSEKWYDCKDGKADMSKVEDEITYDDYSTKYVLVITKSDDDYSITEYRNESIFDTWSHVGSFEYRQKGGTGLDKIVIKSVSEKTMVIEYYDHYYSETGQIRDYGVLTYMR